MSTTLLTFLLSFALILLSAVGLSIGKILTGKNKLRKMCGHTPNKAKKESCGKDVTCPLCEGEMKRDTDGDEE